MLIYLALLWTTGMPSWRARRGTMSWSWSQGPQPRRRVRVGKDSPTGSLARASTPPPPHLTCISSPPRPGGCRGGRGLLCLHGPHGPGADLPAWGRLAVTRAGLGRLVAGRARGGTGAHPPQVYHSTCGVSLEALLLAPPPPPGFQSSNPSRTQSPRSRGPRLCLADCWPAPCLLPCRPQTQSEHSKYLVFPSPEWRSSQWVRGCCPAGTC